MFLKRLAFLILLFAGTAFGQSGIRFGDTSSIVSVQTPAGFISVVPNAGISFCNSPANATPCTNKATTYTDITLGTACPTSTQITLRGSSTCVGTTDAQGNWGVWVASGTYTYTVQLPGGGYVGPYTVTLAGGGGGGGATPAGILASNFSNAAGTAFGVASCNGGTFSVDSVTSTTRIDDPCNSYFASGIPYYDVQSAIYGAKCDGVTDDTAAITAAVNAMNANLPGNASSPGVLYFSRSAHPCMFNGNVFQGPTSKNPKYVLMDNSFLLTGAVMFAPNVAGWNFVGRAGTYQGLGGTSALAGSITWASTGNFPSLDLNANMGALWFEGINFIGFNNAGATAPAVHMHDNCSGVPNNPVGCGASSYVTFIKDGFSPSNANQVPLLMDASGGLVTSAFGVYILNSTFNTTGNQPYNLEVINGGSVVIRDTNFGGTGGILFQNNGISLAGDLTVENGIDENLNSAVNPDFLTINSGSFNEGTFIIKNMQLADSASTYLIKNLGAGTVDVEVDHCQQGACGAGILDPSSAKMKSFICIGAGSSSADCSTMVTANKSNVTNMILIPGDGNGLYSFQSAPGESPAVTVDGGLATDLQTISANQSLSCFHYGYNITGTTTVTIPQLPCVTGWPSNQWHLFNSGAGTVTVQCSTGNTNGSATVTMAAKTGGIATSDGSNCFLDAGAGSGGGGGFANPMTTLGDIIYENATPVPARLPGNTTTNPNVLMQTGTGSISAIPVWTASVGGGPSPVTATVSSAAQSQILVYDSTPKLINSYAGVNVDAQTGAYNLQCPLDRLGRIEFNIPVARVLTVPQAGATACLQSSYAFIVANTISSTAVLSVTATSSTFQPEGVSTYALLPGESLLVYSDATTTTGNYHASRIPAYFGGVNIVTTSYTASAADRNKMIVGNCSAACVITLPAAPPTAIWTTQIVSIGSTLATVSLNSLTFNGSGTAPALSTGSALSVFTDGSNYFGSVPSAGGGGVASVSGSSPINSSGGTTPAISCATCAIGPGSSTANDVASFLGTDGLTLADAGGPIPANTTATSHQFFTAYMQSSGAYTKAQPAFNDISGNPSLAQQCTGCTQMLVSTYTNPTSGSPTNVTSLSFTAVTGTNYRYVCDGNYEGGASTAGPAIDFTGPSSPTLAAYSIQWTTGSGGTSTSGVATSAGFGTVIGGTGAAPTAIFVPFHIVLNLQMGTATTGAVQLQAAPNGANTLTIQAGMTCHVDVVQ